MHLSKPATRSHSFDVKAMILAVLLLGFFLARFAAPFFTLLPPCKFRSLFGIPCPSCGASRAGLALANGELMSALAYNPLLVMSIGILFGWSACRVFKKWRGDSFGFWEKVATKFGDFGLKARQQWLRWAMIAAIFLNWLYLIFAAKFSA